MDVENGGVRVVIENVKPEVDGGRFPIKRTVGESITVEADVFADGHDELGCVLLYRMEGDSFWNEAPMTPLVNDLWRGEFSVASMGVYQYTLQGWIDHFESWRRGFLKKVEAGQETAVELKIGAKLIEETAGRAAGEDARLLREEAGFLLGASPIAEKVQALKDDKFIRLAARYPDRRLAAAYHRLLSVVVDRERGRFSAWYEMFPRSCAAEPGRHGTFRDCEARIPYVAAMGFDVLYLPPIHPVGSSFRKGKNNAVKAEPGDPGSPWGIGAAEGGHKAIHPELGTLDDFQRLLAKAREYSIEVALDIAFQCSPDHPYVKQHPEWFRHRPDGTVQYAENPPKKYQDIYPINFETDKWRELWDELKSIFLYWIGQGVKIFRVDNPHTKPFGFWEWLIAGVKKKHPETLFLAEAFTRPKPMYRLAKLGFTQSYTYFTWRNGKEELIEYFTELTKTKVSEFYRPNLWPNTPDILNEFLQHGGRPAFMIRLVLAATLGASYGIYGPPFEHCVNVPRERGSEEYLDSEKYEIKHWDLDPPEGLKHFIARVNRIRAENPALRSDRLLEFHPVDNGQMLCYSKRDKDARNIIFVVVNLNPYQTQIGWVDVPADLLKLDPNQSFQVHDLLTDARYEWHVGRNYVELNPHVFPAHIFRIGRRTPDGQDFEYFG